MLLNTKNKNKLIMRKNKANTNDNLKMRMIEVNYFMMEAISKNDINSIKKCRIEFNSLIKTYLKLNEKVEGMVS
jgi:hypothetical protein